MGDSKQYQLNNYARNVIRHKASQLIGKHGFMRDDYDDLTQEMALDLLLRLSKFDPKKASLNTFIARIVDRKVSTILRHREQDKRDYRRQGPSLDEPIDDAHGEAYGEHLSQDDYDLEARRQDRPEAERLDMHLDVALVISGLPPELKALAERLLSQSITEAARELGIARGTLYGSGIARLRKIFEDKGLRDYL